MRNGRRIVVVGAFACALIIAYVAVRYRSHGRIRLADGSVVSDLSVAEVHDYATPRNAGLRSDYLYAERRYNLLPRTAIPNVPTAVDEQLMPRVVDALRDGPLSTVVFARQPPEVIASLRGHWSLVLARGAGLTEHEYVSQLPAEKVLGRPTNSGVLKNTLSEFLGGRFSNVDDAPESLKALFDALYAASVTDGSQSSRLTALSLSESGLRLAMDYVDTPGSPDLLADRLPDDQLPFFVGDMTQGQLLFYHPPEPTGGVRQRHVLRAEMIAICWTASGDAYPVCIESELDSTTGHWWLHKVARELSPKMVFTVPLAF